jgi:peptidyl-prolyl cis-trans isomerase D
MFELIRERKKLLLILLLLLVIPPFVVVGAWDRVNPASGTVVASVNGKDIYQRDWEVAHQQLIDDFKQRIGQDIPEEVFNSQSAREVTLDDMINREILQVVTQNLSIYVTNEAVKSVISSIPQFQTDGKFDLQKAQDFLKDRGTRSDLFESGVRNDLALRTIPSAISETAFVPRSVARKIAQAENEDRQIRVKFFSSLNYKKDISISNEEVEDFYNQKKDMFQIPARYDLEFILVKESDQLEEIVNSVYEESDSLNPTAASFDLKIRNASGFTFGQNFGGSITFRRRIRCN